MRVLVATPMLQSQIYLPTVQSVFLQQWDGPLDYLFLSGGDGADGYQAVTDKYERARYQALRGGFDYLFCVEADMLIPPDALTKLVSLGADVAYGLYCWRHGKALGLWSAYPVLGASIGYSLSCDKAAARDCWGQPLVVNGVGLGCTLIARHVLQSIVFHHALGDNKRPIPVHCDWCLAEDCQRLGFTQVTDLSIVCGHILNTEPRMVVWPDPNEADLYRIDSLAA